MVKNTYIAKTTHFVSQYCQVALLVPQSVLPYLGKSTPPRLSHSIHIEPKNDLVFSKLSVPAISKQKHYTFSEHTVCSI
jgi:hypothetical protein